MKIRTKNKQLARLRKRNALAQSLRCELLRPSNGNGDRRQLAIDPAHRQPLGLHGPARPPKGTRFVAERHEPSGLAKRIPNEIPGGLRRSANKNPTDGAKASAMVRPPASHSETLHSENFRSQASDSEALYAQTALSEKTRPRAQIVTYGAAAIADGTRIVRVDASVDIACVQEGDRFGVDAMGRSATFEVISVGFRPRCLEVDRPLPRGRYGWSIQRDCDGADRGCGKRRETALETAGPISSATNSATSNPPPLMSDSESETDQRIPDTSVVWFDGKTRIERDVPRDPHLSNDGNQLDGNEATFAFWLNRTATVIRPETLMLGVDQVTGEAFTIALSPTLVRSSSNNAHFRFDLEVTPKSGRDACPVRWTVEHPRSPREWQFIALVTDREGGVRLWINGRGGERQQSTAGIAQHDYLSLGDGVLRHGVRSDGIERLIPTGLRDSWLDSFAVWSRSLSGAELQRAMTESPLAATQDGSLQLYWQLSTSVHASTARLFGNARRSSQLILDASGTLRHGVRITGLQSQQQDWRGMVDHDAPSDLAG